MKFVHASHKLMDKTDVLWREEDGSFVVGYRKKTTDLGSRPPNELMRNRALTQNTLWIGRARRGEDARDTYETLSPIFVVEPFHIGMFLLADILEALGKISRTSSSSEAEIHLHRVAEMYAAPVGATDTERLVTPGALAHRTRRFGNPGIPPKAKRDPLCVDGFWRMKDGTVLHIGDLSDRHLKNIVSYIARRIAEDKVHYTYLTEEEAEFLGHAGTSGMTDESAAIIEAKRRGLVDDFAKQVNEEVDRLAQDRSDTAEMEG